MNHPTTPDPITPVTLTEAEQLLTRSFGGRWLIRFEPVLRMWTAERNDGAGLRYLVDRSAQVLAARLEQIESEEKS